MFCRNMHCETTIAQRQSNVNTPPVFNTVNTPRFLTLFFYFFAHGSLNRPEKTRLGRFIPPPYRRSAKTCCFAMHSRSPCKMTVSETAIGGFTIKTGIKIQVCKESVANRLYLCYTVQDRDRACFRLLPRSAYRQRRIPDDKQERTRSL